MGTTPKWALRYPDPADPADVPTDLNELALDVENAIPPKGTVVGQVAVWDGAKWTAAGGELGYAERATDVALPDTNAVLAVSLPAISFEAKPTVFTFGCAYGQTPGVANGTLGVELYDGSTSLGIIAQMISPVGAVLSAPIFASRRLTPTAGTHTFSARAWAWPNNGKLAASSGGLNVPLPIFIRAVLA